MKVNHNKHFIFSLLHYNSLCNTSILLESSVRVFNENSRQIIVYTDQFMDRFFFLFLLWWPLYKVVHIKEKLCQEVIDDFKLDLKHTLLQVFMPWAYWKRIQNKFLLLKLNRRLKIVPVLSIKSWSLGIFMRSRIPRVSELNFWSLFLYLLYHKFLQSKWVV